MSDTIQDVAASHQAFRHMRDTVPRACELWGDDPWAPGITLSILKDGRYYASLCRWPEPDKRVVLFKARGLTFESALARLSKRFFAAHPIPETPTGACICGGADPTCETCA